MSEIPSPTPEPERPKVKERINAVLLTLRANPMMTFEAAQTTIALSTIAEPVLEKHYPPLKNPNKELPDQTFLDVFQDIMPGATISTLAMFGRPFFQTAIETYYARKFAKKTFSAREFKKSIYNNSVVPYLTNAWRTGDVQIMYITVSGKEKTLEQAFKDGAKQIYRRFFPPKSK